MNYRLHCLLAAGALLLSTLPAAGDQDFPLVLDTHLVPLASSSPDDTVTGRLRSLGMLEVPSIKIHGIRLSQLSGLAWDDDEGILYALSDKGYLFHLKPEIKDGRLIGLSVLNVVTLTEPKNGKPFKYGQADTEGLDILHGRNGRKGDAELLISFERMPRIVRYRPDGKAIEELPLPTPLTDRAAYQSPNQMLESVCVDPTLGVLTAPERPLREEPEGMTRIFSLSGKNWRYPQGRYFGITAMECLGDGRVLVLERDWGVMHNLVTLSLVRLPATPSNEPLAVTNVVTLDASKGHQIDNFEGLTRHKGNRFFMVSDDNDLFVQRTLLLYFELTEL